MSERTETPHTRIKRFGTGCRDGYPWHIQVTLGEYTLVADTRTFEDAGDLAATVFGLVMHDRLLDVTLEHGSLGFAFRQAVRTHLWGHLEANFDSMTLYKNHAVTYRFRHGDDTWRG